MVDLNKIYNALREKGVVTKSYEEFANAMADGNKRKNVYNALAQQGLITKSYKQFSDAVAPSPTPHTTRTQTTTPKKRDVVADTINMLRTPSSQYTRPQQTQQTAPKKKWSNEVDVYSSMPDVVKQYAPTPTPLKTDSSVSMRSAATSTWNAADRAAREEYDRLHPKKEESFWERAARLMTDAEMGMGNENMEKATDMLASHYKTHDLQKLSDQAWNALGATQQKNITDEAYDELKRQYPQATEKELREAAAKVARAKSDETMYNLAVQKNMPDNAISFFARKMAEGNSVASLFTGLARQKAGTVGDLVAETEANERYGKKHKVAGIAGSVVGMASDPLTYAAGGVGGAATKGALWAGGKVLSEAAARKMSQTLGGKLLLGAVSGAANFGTFEAGGEAINQYKWGGTLDVDPETGRYVVGDFSLGKVASQMGHGLTMGGLTGAFGTWLGNVSTKAAQATTSTLGKLGVRAGELGVGLVGEGTIFATPEFISTYGDYNDVIKSVSDKNSPNYIADDKERSKYIAELKAQRGERMMDIWQDNLAMIAGFKAQHAIKSAGRTISELAASRRGKVGFVERMGRMLDGHPSLALSKEEQAELDKHGYGDLTQMVKEYKAYAQKDGDLPYDKITQLLNDKNVSEAARAKMYYYVTGHSLPMSAVIASNVIDNGDKTYTVQSLGDNGVITSRTYGSRKRADYEKARIDRQAELNGVAMAEQMFENMDKAERLKAVCTRLAQDKGVSPETLLWLTRKDPKQMTAAEKRWIKEIEDAANEDAPQGENATVRHIKGVILDEYGVDVDKALRKAADSRTEAEETAISAYNNELAQAVAERKNAISQDETTDAYRRGYEADTQGMRDAYVAQMYEPSEDNAETLRGVESQITESAKYQAALERDELKQMTHKDGSIHLATLKDKDKDGNGKQVYIVDGDIVMKEDGSGIDADASSKSVIIYDPATGEKKMVSPTAVDGIESLGEVKTAEQREAEINARMQDTIQRGKDWLVGNVANPVGMQIQLGDGRIATIEAMHEDGKSAIATLPDGTQFLVPNDVLQRIVNNGQYADYKARRDAEASKREAEQSTESAPETATEGGQPLPEEASTKEEESREYAQGDVFDVVVDGQKMHAEIVSPKDADGRFVVNVDDGESMRTLYVTPEELAAMEYREEPSPKAEETRLATEDSSDKALERGAQPTEEHTPTALERIPRDEKGNAQFHDADTETAWDGLVEMSGNEETAHKVAEASLANAERKLKAARALKEKGETPEELLRSIKENEAAVAEAQRTVAAWKAIVGEKSRREEAAKAEAERIAAEKAEEARVEAERKAEEERIAKQKAEEKTEEAESDKGEAEKRMNDEEPKPVGSGVFGNIYNQFKGKVKEAFDFLMKHKGGDLLGVFHRKDVGDIDLVWGDHGGGLAHIIRRHIIEQNDFKNVDEIQKVIEDVIRNGLIVRENKDKINIEYNGYRVSIKKTIRDSKGNVVENKNWIVTAFDKSKPKHEKRNPSSSETLTTPSANQKADGVTLPSNEDSIDKGSEKPEKKQEKESVFDKAKEIADKEEKKRKAEADKPKQKPLTEAERKDAEEVAGALGYRVEWVDTMEENGTIDADRKVIRIAKDAENQLVQVLGHEVAHGVRRMIGGKFRTLQKAALEVVGEKEWDERIEKKRKLNAYAEGKLAEEVTCDIVGEALNDKDALKRLAESLRGEKGILARLRDAVAKMVEYFKNRGDKEGVRRMKAADRLLAEFESALKEGVAPEQVKPEGVDRSVREGKKDDKTLYGIHNISEDKLRKAMKLGGLANPSMAVVDKDKGTHEGFGAISLIAPSSLVDKQTGRTAGSWITDAYTQRYPFVERVMSDKGYKKFKSWVDGLDFAEKEKKEIMRQATDAMENDKDLAWELMYLREKGVDVKGYTSEVDYPWEKIIEEYPSVEDIIKAMDHNAELKETVTKLAKVEITGPVYRAVSADVRRRFKEETGENASPLNPIIRKRTHDIYNRDYAPKLLDENGMPKASDVRKVIGQMVEKYNATKKVDFNKSKSKASTYVHGNGLYADYLKWQEGKLEEFGTQGRIFRGYKNDGTRKYVPETLSNVSKAMKEESQGQTNGSEYTSFGSFIAKLAPRVDSKEEMRGSKSRLDADEAKQEFYEKWESTYYDLATELHSDVFSGEARLHDIVLQSDPKRYAKKEYGITLSPSFLKRLEALKKAIREDLKSAYFETKFERPVMLNEFAAAVVPKGIGDDVRKGLEDAGLVLYEYDPAKKGDRERAANEASASDGIRFNRSEKTDLTAEERELRDNLVERMRKGGLDVVTDSEEMQRVIDTENERTRMMGAKQKRALETATIAAEATNNATVISSADGAKIQNNLGTLATNYEKIANRTRGFITDLSHALGLKQHESSQYGTFETPDGKRITIRVSNHNARVSNFDKNNESEGISIVISSHKNKGLHNDGNAHIIEYFYPKRALENAEGKPLAEMIRSVSDALAGEEFKDTTGLAEREEVNGSSVREHRVYHGSGADFDAFDHSHMGEGEGAQAYGWGTYVTEVEGIGRTYAIQNTTTHNDALRALQHDVDAISDQLNRHRDDLKYDEEQLKRANEWRAEAELDYELFKDEAEKLKEKYGEASPKYRNHLFNDIYTDEMNRAQSSVKSTEESIQYRKEKIAELEKALKDKQAEIDELPKEFPRHLYTVEIPDDNGGNYLDWDGHPTESLLKDVGSFLESNGFERVQDSPARYEKGESTVVLNPNATGADLYAELREALGSDKKASQALAELGCIGIKYPADNMRGGREDGTKNYVIFNENDAKITDHTRFLRTAGGEVYGLVKDGRIYLDPKVATAETAVHEYTHLWGDMLRRKDSEQWNHTVKELKNSVLWEEVKELYPELKTDDEIADEVLSTFSGRRGAERLREEARRVADGEGGVFTKAKAIETLERVKEAIARFWEGVARMFGINRYRSVEELADMAMKDLLDSKNPMKDESGMRKRGEVGETLATSGTYFSGGGLLEAGLKGVIDPKVAVEFSEKIAGVYADNHGNHIVVADVRDVDPKKLVGAVDGGEVQYFHASPVCKNFSKAKREGGEVELDKETALSTAEFIAKTRPKVVTIENVKGYRNSEALKIITDELTRQGYDWDADVYNTADYGGYTKRERLIVRAKRDGKLPPKPEKLPEELRKKGWYSAVEDLIPHLEEKKTGVPQGTDERLKNSGIDYRTIDKPLYVFGRGYANKTVGHAFADELLPTLTTGGGDIIIMPDGRVLKASPRVLARVTGLPDTYKMPETDQLSHTIVGNGIPTQLTEGVIAPLLDNAIPSAERSTKRESVFDVADRVSQNLEERTRAMAVKKANDRFNEELELQVKGELEEGHVYKLGMPSEILLSTGVPNLPIELSAKQLSKKAADRGHRFDVKDIANLPQAIQAPIAVFEYGNKDKSQNLIVEIERDGKKFVVGIHFNQNRRGIVVNDIRGLFNKDSHEWLNWISQGKLLYADKEKIQALMDKQRTNLAEVNYLNLDDVAKKVKDFENPKLFDGKISEVDKKGSDSIDRSVRENPKNEDKPRFSRKPGESIFDYASRVSEDVDRSVRERVSARDEYEKKVKSKGFQTKEALQNSMLGLQEFMSAIDHASGNKRYIEDIPDFENPILGENRLSSVNKEEMHQVAKTQFKPLMSAVAKLSGNGKESGELYDYMFAKHGLERDAVMRQREAQKEFDKYQKANPKGTKTIGDFVASLEGKDYAGLTALTAEDGRVKSIQSQIDAIDEQMKATDDQLLLRKLGGQKKRLKVDLLNAARDAADDIRKAFESNPSHDRSDINELWSRVNEVNGNTLRKLYESGMLTKEVYNDISSMYTNYIPMRGFDQTTSADAYAYLTHGDSAFNAPIKTAKGRSSKADNPIAYMQAMAESAIMQGNRNVLVKQKMLNFVRNHPSDLASVSDVWLQYDSVADEWKPVFPDNIGANDSASVVAKKMEAFEDKMKQMAEKHPDLVQRSNEAPDIPYKVVEKGQLNEHQVLVKQNGKSYIITVNGSPRAAQAANGLTNPDTDLTGAVGKVFEGAEALNRQLSSLYTTLNPDFIGSNYVRDALYSNTMVYVKEGAKYGGSFNLNFAKYNPAEMANLYARYNKGSLDTSNETHRLFLEFMQNGGETGFVNLKQIEKRKSEIAKAIKRDGRISAAQIWGGLGDAVDFANRAVENSARFAAYVTSRKSGRSVGRSVYDAKEISVNFNRKGSGSKFMGAEGQTKAGNAAAFVSGAGRGLYIFWNAGLQGLTNFSRQIGRHPGRALTLASLLFGFGALMSYLGNRDDDDENNYFNLPKYIRRSNVCYKIGDLFVTIPLPVEYRAFYGLGELASSTLAGKEDGTTKDIAKEAVSQVSQLFPIDFVEGGGGLHALIPSAVKPIVEAETNTAWTGLPIYKDNDFNKNMPEYTKVYKTANGYLVEIARALNDATGGNKYKKGFIDINPAKMEYVLKGMLGGAFSFPDKLVKTTETIMGDREFDWRNTPFANRFVKNADERTEYKSLNEQYFKLKDEMDVVKQQLKGFEKEADAGNEKYEKALLQLEDSKDYERLELFKDYEKELKGLNDELKELRMSPDYDKVEEKELQKEIAELQRQLIDEMREIKK
jgi:site-specific DNA-cytosine methylase